MASTGGRRLLRLRCPNEEDNLRTSLLLILLLLRITFMALFQRAKYHPALISPYNDPVREVSLTPQPETLPGAHLSTGERRRQGNGPAHVSYTPSKKMLCVLQQNIQMSLVSLSHGYLLPT